MLAKIPPSSSHSIWTNLISFTHTKHGTAHRRPHRFSSLFPFFFCCSTSSRNSFTLLYNFPFHRCLGFSWNLCGKLNKKKNSSLVLFSLNSLQFLLCSRFSTSRIRKKIWELQCVYISGCWDEMEKSFTSKKCESHRGDVEFTLNKIRPDCCNCTFAPLMSAVAVESWECLHKAFHCSFVSYHEHVRPVRDTERNRDFFNRDFSFFPQSHFSRPFLSCVPRLEWKAESFLPLH